MKIINAALFLTVVAGVLFVHSETEGEDWQLWYRDSNGILFYYDKDSIKNHTEDIISVTGKIEGSDVVILDPDTRKIDERYQTRKLPCSFEFNCSLRTYRMLSSTIIHETGHEEKMDNPEGEWIIITAGSFFEPLYKEVCESR